MLLFFFHHVSYNLYNFCSLIKPLPNYWFKIGRNTITLFVRCDKSPSVQKVTVQPHFDLALGEMLNHKKFFFYSKLLTSSFSLSESVTRFVLTGFLLCNDLVLYTSILTSFASHFGRSFFSIPDGVACERLHLRPWLKYSCADHVSADTAHSIRIISQLS